MEVLRLSAFTSNGNGGNPAGVVFCDEMPSEQKMLSIAAEVGYSETAFLVKQNEAWRVRYFAPEQEVPFCGHATIALGAALGQREGEGLYHLILNESEITVTAKRNENNEWQAILQSPPTWSKPVEPGIIQKIYTAFNISEDDLDISIPTALAHAGANHLVIGLKDRQALADMEYPFDVVKTIMLEADLTTISLIWAKDKHHFHVRNPFPVGGVYEDPATGAAAAALGGYLRDIGWIEQGKVEIFQGEDMGSPSHLTIDIGSEKGESIRVSGAVSNIE